jgi:DNA (cytosine-5)-methyltransferase 1
MKNPKVLSLFSGAGGLDIGFHLNGFEIKACIEIDKDSCKTIEANRPKYVHNRTKIYCKDITTLNPKDVKEEIGEIEFMIGGPPCQSFSAAGRRAGGVYGVNDTRGSLFWYYCEFLKVFKPKGFLFENVKGILQANKNKDWNIIKSSFSDIGYKLSYIVLDAADFGVPQHRERLIMVGLREESEENNFIFPRPVYGPNSETKTPYVTPQTAFEDIEDPNEDYHTYSGKYGYLLNDIPPGQNYSFYTEKMGHPEPKFAWRSKFSGFLYKLSPDEPSKTLVAHQGKYDGPFHWKNRKLNIKELSRIQSFPNDYIFTGTEISVAKQIGNSVAPKFSEYLAKSVLKQVFDSEIEVDLLKPGETLDSHTRKSIKARATRRKTIKTVNPAQAELFTDEIVWPTENIILDLYRNEYYNNCKLKNGVWEIKAENIDKSVIEIEYELSFTTIIAKKFNKIVCILSTSDINEFHKGWDFIHKLIATSSSYEDVRPLYGHFTEPYPKFELKISINGDSSPLSKFILELSDFKKCNTIHDLSSLDYYWRKKISYLQIVKLLRNNGFDIRINQTNRTIPEGKFRICYPFTMPSWSQTYVKWVEIGSHGTSDINIEEILGKHHEY